MHRTRLVLSALAAGLLSSQAWAADPLLIESIDVEGGAATLYITPEHQSLLIDTGWPAQVAATDPDSAQRIIAAAQRHGLTQIDYVLVTHYHVDHVGGFSQLLAGFPVGMVLDHGPNREQPPPKAAPAFASFQPATLYPQYLAALKGHKHRSLKPGDTLEIGSMHLTVITSDAAALAQPLPGAGEAIPECATMEPMTETGGEENVRSVGVLLTFGSARIASFGDLTWNIEKALVCPKNKVGPVDLFFVSNHGTHVNNSPAFLHALSPRIALMNNGAHKGADPATFEALAAAPHLQRLWQLHRAEGSDAQHNPPEAYVANPDASTDTRASLTVSVTREGAFTVTNGRTGFSETYPPAGRP